MIDNFLRKIFIKATISFFFFFLQEQFFIKATIKSLFCLEKNIKNRAEPGNISFQIISHKKSKSRRNLDEARTNLLKEL